MSELMTLLQKELFKYGGVAVALGLGLWYQTNELQAHKAESKADIEAVKSRLSDCEQDKLGLSVKVAELTAKIEPYIMASRHNKLK